MKRRYRFSQNLLTFLLSLSLAFLFWVVATETENPTREEVLPARSVTLKGLLPDLYAYGYESAQVRLVVRAPASVLSVLQVSDVDVYLNVEGLSPGTHVLPVEVALARRPIRVISIEPEKIAVQIEQRLTRQIPVRPVVQGTPALGYQAGELQIAPQKVVITGPASSVERAAEAQVVLDIGEKRQSIRGDFRLRVVDQAGKELPYVSCDPATVTVALVIEQLGNYRDMAVKVNLTGQPAPGYRVTRVEVDPPIVTAFGPTDMIRALEGYIETAPVSLNQLTAPISLTVLLQVPTGLSVLLPAPQVQVVVRVEPIQGSITLERALEIQGNTLYTATVAPPTVSIILSGPLPILERLDPNTVHAIVDVSDLAPGDYVLEVKVIAPPNLKVESILPQTVSVSLKKP